VLTNEERSALRQEMRRLYEAGVPWDDARQTLMQQRPPTVFNTQLSGQHLAIVDAIVQKWVPEELYHVDIVMADLGARHGEYDRKKDVVRLNPRIFADRNHLRKTLLHELGHAYAAHHDLDDDPAFLQLSGWVKTREQKEGQARYVENRPGWPAGPSEWVYNELAWFTRPYATSAPAEDMADCFSWVWLKRLPAFQYGGKQKLRYVEQHA